MDKHKHTDACNHIHEDDHAKDHPKKGPVKHDREHDHKHDPKKHDHKDHNNHFHSHRGNRQSVSLDSYHFLMLLQEVSQGEWYVPL